MKLAIIGSRGFNDYELLKSTLKDLTDVQLMISGGAKGADSLGERWARENNIQIKIFYPDWDRFGKSAGFIRNKDIVANADVIVAFWDGSSRGTKMSMDLAESSGKQLITIRYNDHANTTK